MRFTTLALTALIFAAPAGAFAQGEAGGGMPTEHGGMGGFLTPEQRYMYMQEQKTNGTDWQSMTPDQRRAQRQATWAKFRSMNEADKAKLKADMQAKFDALTPDQKQAIEQKMSEHRTRVQQMKQSGGQQQ